VACRIFPIAFERFQLEFARFGVDERMKHDRVEDDPRTIERFPYEESKAEDATFVEAFAHKNDTIPNEGRRSARYDVHVFELLMVFE
jgi:hypothetical protein